MYNTVVKFALETQKRDILEKCRTTIRMFATKIDGAYDILYEDDFRSFEFDISQIKDQLKEINEELSK